MLTTTLKLLFNRDLRRLIDELEQYPDEADIWNTRGEISNSAGNLCLHVIGNLNTYIGKELGGTNYIRDREAEFSLKNVARNELAHKVENVLEVINLTLDQLDEGLLQNEYPILVLQYKTSIEYLLVHLSTHLNYHLGQINYHRRMIGTLP